MKRVIQKDKYITIYETKLTDEQEKNGVICLITQHTVTLPPHHMSIVPLTPINYTANMHTNILIEIEENPFFSIE